MKKLKDFLYNHNDLVVVLVILCVAGLIIASRVDAILSYPSTLSAASSESGQVTTEKIAKQVTQEDTGETSEEKDVIESIDSDLAAETEDGESTLSPLDEKVLETEKKEQEEKESQSKAKPAEGEIVQFTIASGQYNSWTPLAKDLEEAGIVDSWKNFMDAVYTRSNKGTLGNFYTKTYEIPAGADYNAIIDILNKK